MLTAAEAALRFAPVIRGEREVGATWQKLRQFEGPIVSDKLARKAASWVARDRHRALSKVRLTAGVLKGHGAGVSFIHLDAPASRGRPEGLTIAETIADLETADPRDVIGDLPAGFVDALVASLKQPEQLVVREVLMRGRPPASVAGEMGVSGSRVGQIVWAVTQKLRRSVRAQFPELAPHDPA